MKIRAANPDDISVMVALQQASASAAHWSREQYGQMFAQSGSQPERSVLVAEQESGREPAGFLVARRVDREWELENIVVAGNAQRQGLGHRLVEALLAQAKQSNGAAVFLEVRESNVAARTLYERTGFRQMGRRKGYYTSPMEDAILYRLGLD
jgi:ribosomal-protein-alanine N-acetyltransferase